MKKKLDFIDRQIIGLLQENARMSLKDIASRVYLSSPAASARMDKLEREGYITGFLDYMRQCRNVIECSCITGDYAMLLEVVYPCTEALEQFVAKIQRYGKTKTQIVYSTAVERRGVLQEPEIEKAG